MGSQHMQQSLVFNYYAALPQIVHVDRNVNFRGTLHFQGTPKHVPICYRSPVFPFFPCLNAIAFSTCISDLIMAKSTFTDRDMFFDIFILPTLI